ncbi:hypothetical protein [Promicromonospora soli]
MRVVGRGESALNAVRCAAHVLGCRAPDCSTSEFIENGGHHGWDEFQAYRDMVYQRAR